MKTIATLTGPDFLLAANRARYAVEKLMTVAGISAIRKQKPNFTGKENPQLKKIMEQEQTKKNLNDMLDALLEKCPEETYACIMALCIRDEGEPEPDGIDLLMAALSLISDKRVIDFFLQLGGLGLFDTDI